MQGQSFQSKEDLRAANAKHRSTQEDARVTFQRGCDDFWTSEAYARDLEEVFQGGFTYTKKLVKDRFSNLDVDSLAFDAFDALSFLE